MPDKQIDYRPLLRMIIGQMNELIKVLSNLSLEAHTTVNLPEDANSEEICRHIHEILTDYKKVHGLDR